MKVPAPKRSKTNGRINANTPKDETAVHFGLRHGAAAESMLSTGVEVVESGVVTGVAPPGLRTGHSASRSA
jgi:hypothetical protein